MSIIVHISDLHIQGKEDRIHNRLHAFCTAVADRIPDDTRQILIINSGDTVYSGQQAQFQVAFEYFMDLIERLKKRGITAQLAVVPGNHDCLFHDDEAARDQLLEGITADAVLAPSIEELVVEPLDEYFRFAPRISGDDYPLTTRSPYYGYRNVRLGDNLLDIHLVNTAWMSQKHERHGTLRFPVPQIDFTPEGEADCSLVILHHPIETWFAQPDSMRPLRSRLHDIGDVILTGHEHVQRVVQSRLVNSGGIVLQFEGGVFQESPESDVSEFSMYRLDFENRICTSIQFAFDSSSRAYIEKYTSEAELHRNPNRSSPNRLSSKFLEFLDDPELPITHARAEKVRLSDFFTFPDFRAYETPDEDQDWKRLHGEDFVAECLAEPVTLVTGSSKVGKTSCAKRLTYAVHRRGAMPVYLDGKKMRNLSDSAKVRRQIRRAVDEQYESVSGDGFATMEKSSRVAVLDDAHVFLRTPRARSAIMNVLEEDFAAAVLFADEEVCFEQMNRTFLTEPSLGGAKRFDICELGLSRVRQLATQWVLLGHKPTDDLNARVEQVCAVVESVLRQNAIPHYPWIVIVLLQQADANQTVAAKNGSYGHLFQSILTFAVANIGQSPHDIQTLFGYLGDLAYELYRRREAIIDEDEARSFHAQFCDRKLVDLDWNRIQRDLIKGGILRNDEGQIAFRGRFTFCFFVAWYFSRHLHEPAVREEISHVVRNLHHVDAANIVVFLAHLSNDPHVLNSLHTAAKELLASVPEATLDDDVHFLNTLQPGQIALDAPTSSPDANRRAIEARVDEEIAGRTKDSADGRKSEIRTLTDQPATESALISQMLSIDSALQTIRILGQILRNNAGTIDGQDKIQIIKDVYALAARVIGCMLGAMDDGIVEIASHLARSRAAAGADEPSEAVTKKVVDHLFGIVWYGTFCMCRKVGEALSHESLAPCFAKVIEESSESTTARTFDLAVELDRPGTLPISKASELHEELIENRFTDLLVRALVLDHLFLYDVRFDVKQKVCAKLGINVPVKSFGTTQKRIANRVTKGK